MENVIVAASNLIALASLLAWSHDTLVFIAILFSMSMSFLYHLAERNKHDMPGYLPVSGRVEQRLLNLDRFAAVFLSILLVQRVVVTFQLIVFGAVTAFFGFASEHPALAVPLRSDQRLFYIYTHSIWHMLAFSLAWLCAYASD